MKKITKIAPAATLKKKKRRVAAYCRVSTGMDDQLVSLETQKAHYEEYITGNPDWVFAGLYYDEGISGTKKEKRPALLKMISDCEAGKIDYILTKSLSRFARNTTDCLELVRKLLDLGIPIFFEKENLDTGSMESELMLSIMSSLAESESVSISENSKWSIRHRFETGTFKIGRAPYGYRVKDGELSINDEEAKWVRFIFAETLAGKSSIMIAAALNEKQVPARRADHWTSTTVRSILRNEKYIGDCLFQKTYTDFRFKKRINRGEQDQFYIKDHHEPIITREDFEAADQMLRQNAKERNVKKGDDKYNRRYPFTGRIVCGECGSFFKRRINSTGSLKYPVWACKEHLRNKEGCSMKFIRESDFEAAFATMMNKLIFARKEILQALFDEVRSRSYKASLHRLDQIDRGLESITEQQEAITKIVTKGYIDQAAYTQEINHLQAERSALEIEREKLTREVSGDMKKTESLRDILKFTENGTMLSGFDAELFDRLVERISVQSREEIVFHLKCGLSLTERIG